MSTVDRVSWSVLCLFGIFVIYESLQIKYYDDRSRNGVFVNQQRERLVRGRPHALQSGDTILIETYEIRVSVSSAGVADRPAVEWDAAPFGSGFDARGATPDPFADDPFAPNTLSKGEAVRPDLGVSQGASEDRELDPLNLLGGAAAPAPPKRRPQARDLDESSPIAAHYKAPAVHLPPAAVGPVEIPADYDPLADSGITPIPGKPAAFPSEKPGWSSSPSPTVDGTAGLVFIHKDALIGRSGWTSGSSSSRSSAATSSAPCRSPASSRTWRGTGGGLRRTWRSGSRA